MSIKKKLEEIFFDYHIRGCKLTDKKSNAMCNQRKQQDIQAILAEVIRILPEEKETKNWGTSSDTYYKRKGYNQCLSDIKARLRGDNSGNIV